MATARTTEGPLALLARTAGSPADVARKARRLARAIATLADSDVLRHRLDRLVERGLVDRDRVPTRLQLVVGGIDMLRFWISPAAAQYYEERGISFGFHQLLRVLDDPASMIDPVGLGSDRDVVIGHLMQVVHANPCYDLQLLEIHEDGVAELERQLDEMIAGTHPRATSIGAIVEDPDYHRRLLAYVRAYREAPDAPAPVRENVAADPRWEPIERTFGSLSAAMRYFARLPRTPAGAVRHLLTVRSFPHELAER